MKALNFLLGWSQLGIQRGDLVLEVGSGGHPFPRSDILCDLFPTDNTERAMHTSIVIDRPFVCADAEKLPFKTKAFDFLFSSHTLEHLIFPERFLEEAMRVSRRGLLITPSEFCERIMPWDIHLWMISIDTGTLVLKQKHQANESNIPNLFHQVWLSDRKFRRFFVSRPDLFETRFCWEDRFTYSVSRYEEKPLWLTKGQAIPVAEIVHTSDNSKEDYRTLAVRQTRAILSKLIRTLHSGKRGRNLDSLLACPVCHSDLVRQENSRFVCIACHKVYPIYDGVPILIPDTIL